MNGDEAQVCPDEVLDVTQRYVGAVLYFSTSGDNWLTCNRQDAPTVNPCPARDGETPERYLSEADICEWFEMDCNESDELIRISVGTYCEDFF